MYTIYLGDQLIYVSDDVEDVLCLSQKKIKMEVDEAGSFEFTIQPNYRYYNSFQKMKSLIYVYEDSTEIFSGRVTSITDNTYKERKIQCEGRLAFLIDTIQPPDEVKTTDTSGEYPVTETTGVKETIAAHFRKLITQHNSQIEDYKKFTVGNITVNNANTTEEFSDSSYRDTMSAIKNDLLDCYGGHIQLRKSGSTYYIDYIQDFSTTATQVLEFGENIVDYTKEASPDDLFTILLPIGDEDLTIASVNSGSPYLQNTSGVNTYGKIYKTESFSGISDANQLKTTAQKYMDANYKGIPDNFTIKAVDMHKLNPNVQALRVGQKIRILSTPHEVDVTKLCRSVSMDLDNPENDTYDLGEPKRTLTQQYSKANRMSSSRLSNAEKEARGASNAARENRKHINTNVESIKINSQLLTIHANDIALNANDIQMVANSLTANVQTLNATINDLNATITGKIEVVVNGLTVLSNDHYDLKGKAVTFVNLGSAITNLGYVDIGQASISSLWVSGYFTCLGQNATWQSKTVVTSVGVTAAVATDGNGNMFRYLNGFDRNVSTIYYLGR